MYYWLTSLNRIYPFSQMLCMCKPNHISPQPSNQTNSHTMGGSVLKASVYYAVANSWAKRKHLFNLFYLHSQKWVCLHANRHPISWLRFAVPLRWLHCWNLASHCHNPHTACKNRSTEALCLSILCACTSIAGAWCMVHHVLEPPSPVSG